MSAQPIQPYKTIDGAPYTLLWRRVHGRRTVPPNTIRPGDWLDFATAAGGFAFGCVKSGAAVFMVQVPGANKPNRVQREQVLAVYRTTVNPLDALL